MREIGFNVIGRAVIALALIPMMPVSVADQSSIDQSSKSSFEDMLDRAAENKLRQMNDIESAPKFYGRCVVTSETDKFSDAVSHSLTCYELASVSEWYLTKFGLMVENFINSSRLTAYCDGICLTPSTTPLFSSGGEVEVRYRFDGSDHVKDNWLIFSGYGSVFSCSPGTYPEQLGFLRSVASSARLIFDVGGGEGEINFRPQTNDAVADLSSRCRIDIN